jgi:hypothetical protein
MLTVTRVRRAYRVTGLRPASDVYLDETRGLACPVAAVCLAEKRLRPRQLQPPRAWRNVLRVLDEPRSYVTAFLDAINRWHNSDPAPTTPARSRTTDPILRLMRRGQRDGERVGRALFGPSAVARRTTR